MSIGLGRYPSLLLAHFISNSSVIRQNQEYHITNVHDMGLFPLSTSVNLFPGRMGRDAHRDGFYHAAQAVSVEQMYIQNTPAFEIIQHIGLGNYTIESYDCLNEAFTLC